MNILWGATSFHSLVVLYAKWRRDGIREQKRGLRLNQMIQHEREIMIQQMNHNLLNMLIQRMNHELL